MQVQTGKEDKARKQHHEFAAMWAPPIAMQSSPSLPREAMMDSCALRRIRKKEHAMNNSSIPTEKRNRVSEMFFNYTTVFILETLHGPGILSYFTRAKPC
jgi:hypothetical protein